MPFKYTRSGGSKSDWSLSPRSGETASETKKAVLYKLKALRFHDTLQEIRFALLHRDQDLMHLLHPSFLLFTLPHESMFDLPFSPMASCVCIQSQHGNLVSLVCLAFSGCLFWGLQTSSVPSKNVLIFKMVPGFITLSHFQIKCPLNISFPELLVVLWPGLPVAAITFWLWFSSLWSQRARPGAGGGFPLWYTWPFCFSGLSSHYCLFGGSYLVSSLSVTQAWFVLVNFSVTEAHGTPEEVLYGNRKLLKVHSQEKFWEGQSPQWLTPSSWALSPAFHHLSLLPLHDPLRSNQCFQTESSHDRPLSGNTLTDMPGVVLS